MVDVNKPLKTYLDTNYQAKSAILNNKVYYVSTTGNDSNVGYDINRPFLTLSAALTAAGNSGNQVCIMPGTYSGNYTVTNQNVTIAALNNERGGLVNFTGTLTFSHVASSVRVFCVTAASVVHSGAGSLYLSNCRINTSLSSSGSGYLLVDNTDTQGASLTGVVSITGTGTKNFIGNNTVGFLTINNASAAVNLSNNLSCAPIILSSGTLGIANSPVYSATDTSNAIDVSGATSVIVLTSVTCVTPSNTSARISIGTGSYYSFRAAMFDKANSVLSGTNLPQKLIADFVDAQTFSSSQKGLVPQSNGDSSYYLNGSGNWTIPSGGGGGGGATNLSYTSSSTNGIVVSDTGSDATIPVATSASGSNIAGLMTPAQVDKISNLSAVTNDAQLKRSANDFSSFTAKSSPSTSDVLLIEDAAASGAKKYITANALPVSSAAQSALDAKAALVSTPTSGDILTTNGSGQPVDSGKKFNDAGSTTSDILSASQVDSRISTAQLSSPLAYVTCVSTSNFAASYSNGSSGVGSYLTSTTNGAVTIDGYTLSLNEDVWFNSQTNSAHNGVYRLTTLGTPSVQAVFTRRADFDEPSEMKAGRLFIAMYGSSNKGVWATSSNVDSVGSSPVLASAQTISLNGLLQAANALSELTAAAATVRSNISAAKSGINTDITSISLDQTGLNVKGSGIGYLNIRSIENLTTNRVLNIKVGNADKTLDFTTQNQANGLVSLNSSGNFAQTTDNLPEGLTNKWWTNARTLTSTLTSFVAQTYQSITSSDTVITALQKIESYIQNDSQLFSTGDYKQSAKNSNHGNWLLCNGSAVSRTTYANLFTTLVTTKGTCTISIASPAVVTLNAHGLSVDSAISFTTTGALPTGLSAGVTYYVTSVTTNTFTISATLGGTNINTSGTQSGTHTLFYNPFGVSSATTFNLPDFRGRVFGAIGQGSGLTNRTFGDGVGEEANTLTSSQIPSHRHRTALAASGNDGSFGNTGATNFTESIGGTANITLSVAWSDYAGGGGSHNNMQPTLFAGNVFIYY